MNLSHDKPKISLCMIVKDEERHLNRCLSSVNGAVDEIIIVDTGSRDRSIDIAREWGARLFNFQWQNDFAVARNCSLSHATGEWILYLDADEELTPALARELPVLVQNNEVEGYFFDIVSSLSVRAGARSLRHPNLRLFRHRPGYQFKGAIHEQVIPSILAQNPRARFVFTDLEILHYGYCREEIEVKGKQMRNLEIIRKQLEKNPDDNFSRYNLGVALYENREYEAAMEQFALALENVDVKAGYAPSLFRNYAILGCNLKNYQDVLDVLERGMEEFKDYTDLFYLKGQTLQHMQRYDQAVEMFKKCISMGEAPRKYLTSLGVGGFMAKHCLGQIYEVQGDYGQAVDYYKESFTENSNFAVARFSLLRVLTAMCKDEGNVVEKLESMFVLRPSLLVPMAQVLFDAGEYQNALDLLNRGMVKWQRNTDQTLFLKGQCLFKLGLFKNAAAQFKLVENKSSYYSQALVWLCLSLWLQEPTQNAELFIKKISQENPVRGEIFNAYNNLLFGSDFPVFEETQYIQEVHKLLELLVGAGATDRAKMAVSLLGKMDEGSVLLELGQVYFNLNKGNEAADLLIEAMKKEAHEARLYFMLGRICSTRRIYDEAEKLYRQAMILDPNIKNLHMYLGEVLLRMAEQVLKEGLEHFPESELLKIGLESTRDCISRTFITR